MIANKGRLKKKKPEEFGRRSSSPAMAKMRLLLGLIWVAVAVLVQPTSADAGIGEVENQNNNLVGEIRSDRVRRSVASTTTSTTTTTPAATAAYDADFLGKCAH